MVTTIIMEAIMEVITVVIMEVVIMRLIAVVTADTMAARLLGQYSQSSSYLSLSSLSLLIEMLNLNREYKMKLFVSDSKDISLKILMEFVYFIFYISYLNFESV